MKHPTLDVVIPIFHEQDSILVVIEALEKALTVPHQIVLVYDDPRDPTVPLLEDAKDKFPSITLLHNKLGGYAHAIRTGLFRTESDCVVLFTADGSDRPSDIPIMLEKIEQGADMVLGSRYVPGGEKRGGPIAMNLLSKFGNRLYHMLSGFPLRDVTTSFRMIHRKVINQLELTSKIGGALYLEMTVKTVINGFRVTEIPTIWIDRTKGESKFKLLKWLPGCFYWFCWGIFKYRFSKSR